MSKKPQNILYEPWRANNNDYEEGKIDKENAPDSSSRLFERTRMNEYGEEEKRKSERE